MKNIKWRILCSKTIVWLAAEIILCLVGMDDIADYSEFLFDRNTNNIDTVYLVSKVTV